jgi:hypothetical protein
MLYEVSCPVGGFDCAVFEFLDQLCFCHFISVLVDLELRELCKPRPTACEAAHRAALSEAYGAHATKNKPGACCDENKCTCDVV